MSQRGLVGPDEPRYADIARTMAESGDWITPRLDGQPWFEKPALLYWMGAIADRLGVRDDRATRLPVALMSALFLPFFYWRLRREFGPRPAEYATLILATSAGWVAFSQVGGFDLPLATSLAASLLFLLPWVRESRSEPRALMGFGAFLGVSALAKGLVGPALAAVAVLPSVWQRGPRVVIRDLFRPRALVPFCAVALPWYLLCYFANGPAFLEEFFLRQHWERLADESIQHVQPFWFFVPVLVVAFLPWTPLLAMMPSPETRKDPRVCLLAAWALATFAIFSLSTNKLPGYLLPMLPPLAALAGLALADYAGSRMALIVSAVLLGLLPLAASVLPAALADGLTEAWPPQQIAWWWLAVNGLAAVAVGVLSFRQKQRAAVATLAGFAALGLIHLKTETFHAISDRAGTRSLWLRIEPDASETCIGDVRRHVAYGLNYYSHGALPDCSVQTRVLRVESDPPVVVSQTPR